MPLNPPQVGRLSICNTTVVMQHQLPNAEVMLHNDAGSYSLGTAASVFEVMELPPELTLTEGNRIVATQSLGGETRPAGAHAVVEGTGPTPSLPRPHPGSHIYACADNLGLDGLTPGSTVEIRRATSLLGTGIAHDGAVLVELSAGVPSSPGLRATAITCGLQPVTVTLPQGDPAPIDEEERLPAPSFGSPLMECVDWLRVERVVPGATVVLTRGDGSEQRWALTTRSWLVRLARPLEEGEAVALRQEFIHCGIGGHETGRKVASLMVGPPRLASPWCNGRVITTDLIPGATVIFFDADGREIGRSGAAGTTCEFTVIQPHSYTLFARQEMCGVWSEPSNRVDAGTDPDFSDPTAPRPVIAEPVRTCQTQVRVEGQVNGGLIEIWSHVRGMIGWRHSMGSTAIVGVAALLEDEPIEAYAVTCSGRAGTSDVVIARSAGHLHTPLIAQTLYEGTSLVSVRDVTVGALVDVLVDGYFVNGVVADADPVAVSVAALRIGQAVRARQHLCGQVSEGEPVTVVPPLAPDPEPTRGYSKVVLYNCHTWHRTVNVWVLDHIAGTSTRVGSLESNYDDWGTCLFRGEPLEVELEEGRLYEIVVVDPDTELCGGQDDPMIAGCRRVALTFLGSNSGIALTYGIV